MAKFIKKHDGRVINLVDDKHNVYFPRYVGRDKNLSMDARGIFIYLCSIKNGSKINIDKVIRDSNDPRAVTQKALHELILHKFLSINNRIWILTF